MSSSSNATRISRIHAREVFDSRGKPTVEVEVTCAGGQTGSAIVPSGASTGQFEACELRDGDPKRLNGQGVRRAVQNVIEALGPPLCGMDAADQSAIDLRLCELDGTANKSRLGANALLGVSLATAHAASAACHQPLVEHLHHLWQSARSSFSLSPSPPLSVSAEGAAPPLTTHLSPLAPPLGTQLTLPLPMVNMISGGLHAGKNLDFQDFLILPVGAASYREALEWIVTVYHSLGRVLRDQGHEGTLVGDEGGYGPKLTSNSRAAESIVEAIERAGLEPGKQIALGLDVAATHFAGEGDSPEYRLAHSPGFESCRSSALIDLFVDWVKKYPIVSIEDPLSELDRTGWREITRRLGDRVQLIGDDLFVTNAARLAQGIEEGLANSVLIKVNQIGTLSETFATLRLALEAGYWPVVSARSGETEDATIADLAVATGAGQIKIGSVARSERLAKYNQLLRLEERLGDRATYPGGAIFSSLKPAQSLRS